MLVYSYYNNIYLYKLKIKTTKKKEVKYVLNKSIILF